MSSWHLPMFLNPGRSMPHSMEQDSKQAESSQKNTEYHSEPGDTKLEEASTPSDNDIFTSIQYPSTSPSKKFPLWFPKPYLCNRDFRNSHQALKYIMRYFNFESIHQSIVLFPNLSWDFLYQNTFVEPYQFTQLECHIDKSINDQNQQNALVQRWLELHARYSTATLDPYVISLIL